MKQSVPDIRPNYYEANYDPDKIAPYTLEDPLTFLSGEKVTDAASWEKRRQEILGIFAAEMYGTEPPAPQELVIELASENNNTLGGYAIISQYKMYFKKDKSGPVIDWMVIRPRHAKTPVKPILFLNYRGNQELIPNEEIEIPDMWTHYSEDHTIPVNRGVMCDPNRDSTLPVNMLLANGFAVVSACYCQVSPDPNPDEKEDRFKQDPFAYTGVFDLWEKRDPDRTDNPTALGAWAWALSRGLDLVETIPALDAKNAVVTGCSRLAKAALLAAARDTRFPVCVPVQCGGGGATLAKRDFGENIATEMRMFTHWYCEAYRKYERNPAQLLTFDQHLLVAAVAPRKLLIAGFDSPWFDTEGEYLACRAASPAWEICGKPGFPQRPYPGDFETDTIGDFLGYYRRSEGHGIADFDWLMLMRFAN
ncbi:MAG: hypothetical protein E7058_06880 [Lentisphaerae bacterium]|nr:hypothetical protein [Lentisphaerota bacterium]